MLDVYGGGPTGRTGYPVPPDVLWRHAGSVAADHMRRTGEDTETVIDNGPCGSRSYDRNTQAPHCDDLVPDIIPRGSTMTVRVTTDGKQVGRTVTRGDRLAGP